jgi:phage gp36-like protein
MASQYATLSELVSRLSAPGLKYLLDDNDNGTLDLIGDEPIYLSDALRLTAVEIDAALCPFFDMPFDGRTNDWLVRMHVDLATAWLASRKGANVAEDLKANAAQVRAWLEKIRNGEMRVPGLVYPSDKWLFKTRNSGTVRVQNPPKPQYKKWLS